jgi:hypothetical protein
MRGRTGDWEWGPVRSRVRGRRSRGACGDSGSLYIEHNHHPADLLCYLPTNDIEFGRIAAQSFALAADINSSRRRIPRPEPGVDVIPCS